MIAEDKASKAEAGACCNGWRPDRVTVNAKPGEAESWAGLRLSQQLCGVTPETARGELGCDMVMSQSSQYTGLVLKSQDLAP